MKAKIFQSIDNANRFIKGKNILVDKIDFQRYEVLTCGTRWSEERIVVYYHNEEATNEPD
jgi:hypothetical protein